MKILLWLTKQEFYSVYSNHSDNYSSPINFSYLWGFGFLAMFVLFSQIITGLFLAMHYNAQIFSSFADLEHIMRDVVGGYGLRYIHSNGASMFFIVVYIHKARGLYYGSYLHPRTLLWGSGILIFFLMMAAGFLGYVLPWGQMSFWGATVITNLFSAIPVIGDSIVQWLWGGYSVDNPTLKRFFSFHFVVPFIIVAVVAIHILLLHEHGSNNPLGVKIYSESVPFFYYYFIKDIFGLMVFFVFFTFFVVNIPNALGHPDNFIEAQPLVTPTHIVPEWYFLTYYAILRTIPNKLGGVAAMVLSIIFLIFMPFLDNAYICSSFFKVFYAIRFIFFVIIAITLCWLGQEIVEYPFIEYSVLIASLYFFFFLILLYGNGTLLRTRKPQIFSQIHWWIF